MEADLSCIGMKIKRLREKANLTQKQVADFLSIDQSMISKIEKGERSISSVAVEKLAMLFCCPVSAIISGEDIMPEYVVAFRTTSIDDADLKALAAVNKIVLNQFKMDRLAGGMLND